MSYVAIGKLHSPQGVRGQVFVHIFSQEAHWVDLWQELLMSPASENRPSVTIKIQKWREHQKQKKWGYVLSLDGVTNRNQVEPWVGYTVYVPESFLQSQDGENIYLREVLGYSVVDQKRGPVGQVQGFSGSQWQDLLVISHPTGETFEVPFVEPLLLSIDHAQRQISMDIPYGLVCGEDL
jgi:16S rRNA processing protein RimM